MRTAYAWETASGWVIGNGGIRMELARGAGGGLALVSLRRPAADGRIAGREWAGSAAGSASPALQADPQKPAGPLEGLGWKLAGGTAGREPDGTAFLRFDFDDTAHAAALRLALRCFPEHPVVECSAELANNGERSLAPIYAALPLCLPLAGPAASLAVSAADAKKGHGLHPAGTLGEARSFDSWIVVERDGDALLLGGDFGNGIVRPVVDATVGKGGEKAGASVRAGTGLPALKDGPVSAIVLGPGAGASLPIAFVTLAAGGVDHAANACFRYLGRRVMPAPVPGQPLAACCVWLTDPDQEAIFEEELAHAKRVGFDVFYHDAGWYAGSSVVPGMNDWGMGVGIYEEHAGKFPHGLAELARKVRAAGMKFGIWVDPGNVDSTLVASGDIPRSWLATRGGKALTCDHPSLSRMTQLCLGDRDVQDWIIGKLCAVIERYGLEWLKWDPSGTVTHACDRSDHGHAADGGAWAAFEGRRRILDELLRRFPGLSGFECDPSLRHCRLNPGGRTWLPGGYMCEFMTGPMVGPYVWGSLATVRTTDMTEIRHLTSGWCTASTLDYSLRLHFMRGFTFGNINGMTSQLLSRAPAGYVEAFKRNLLAFKSYRHLLLQDVWHPALASPQDWGALLYAAEGATEAVLFAFRHPGGAQKNVLKLTGLDPAKSYVLTSLNDRPGRERRMAGAALVSEGLALSLPDPWLAKGDGFPGDQYNDQLEFGSDVILIREALA